MRLSENGSDIKGECQMGNMVSDAMLSYKFATVNISTPRISSMNAERTRNSFAICSVALYDLAIVSPFCNAMVSIHMTG